MGKIKNNFLKKYKGLITHLARVPRVDIVFSQTLTSLQQL